MVVLRLCMQPRLRQDVGRDGSAGEADGGDRPGAHRGPGGHRPQVLDPGRPGHQVRREDERARR